ncbi:MAG: hypothetical protein LUO98_04785 [Methanoregula sp.]|nr:hypothetical protein [Methanoregula sp.]
MKKIVLLVMGLLFLPVIGIAYQVNIEAPETLTVGKPLIVTGVTTFPPGMAVDVVLYYQLTTTTEIKRQVVGVRPDKTFRVVFDTTGLKTGTYKVEVPVNGMGDSVTMRLVRIVDRSTEIQMDSPLHQQFSGTLVVAGTIKGDENSGVQVEVIGPDNSLVFGPQFVNTDYEGAFSTEVPIIIPGEYEVSFTDAKGFIGTRIITATGPQVPANPSVATAPKTVVSAHAKASRDSPAYFTVKAGSGPIMLYTSSSFDWVIEFIDENGVLHVENNQDAQNPEKAATTGSGNTIFVKIYPYKYSEQGEVFLYAENADAVSVSPTVPAPFAAAVPEATGGIPAVPLMPLSGFAALGIALLLRR